jgi:O-acetylhomoserine (thiol)-lyase
VITSLLSSLYGGTFNLLQTTLPRLGITTTFVDPSDPLNFTNAVNENTKVFFIEFRQPKVRCIDIQAIAAEAKRCISL